MLRLPFLVESLDAMNRRRLAAACYVAIAAALVTWAACKHETLDSHCMPDSPSYTQDPGCIYKGDGEVAPLNDGKCEPDGDAGAPMMPAVCPLPSDVFTFFTDPTKGNCTSAGCHGNASDPAAGIFFDGSDPQQFYSTLTTVKGTVGKAYVVPGATAYQDSWIVCNLTAKTGGGYPMPPASGVPNYDDVQIVRDWLLCGASGLE